MWSEVSKRMPFLTIFQAFALITLSIATAYAQERYSPFVPTDESDVVRMLKLANLREGDVVFDLGSGDGRIVMEAARMHPRVSGRGIEMDERLVRQSSAAAEASRIADRVKFIHQNAFDADLSEATIITMWLWPELMQMLRPKILAEAKPGTRVITRMWDLGTWPADETTTDGTTLYKWIVPAKVAGYWHWTLNVAGRNVAYSAVLDQRYQTAEGFVRAGKRRAVLNDVKLIGDQISFSMLLTIEGTKIARHQFTGTVRGDVIEGTASVLQEPYEKPVEHVWRAQRSTTSAYFAPTGIEPEVIK